MGIHGQPREGGVTGRVLASPPRSSGAAEGGARGHLLPSVTLLLPLPARGHGAHRKAIGGARIPQKWLKVAPHPHCRPLEPRPVLCRAGRRLSRPCGLAPDPTLLDPSFVQSKKCTGTSARSRHAAFWGPEEEAGVCGACAQDSARR